MQNKKVQMKDWSYDSYKEFFLQKNFFLKRLAFFQTFKDCYLRMKNMKQLIDKGILFVESHQSDYFKLIKNKICL